MKTLSIRLWWLLVAGGVAGCSNTDLTSCPAGQIFDGNRCVVTPAVDAGTQPQKGVVTLKGTVWGPGKTFPVSGAIVMVVATPPDPIPQGTYCQRCLDIPAGVPNATSEVDGTFKLTYAPENLPAGQKRYLVLQKGQFRRVRELPELPEGVHQAPDAMTTLPSRTVPQNGDTIPKIAVVYGDYDSIEDVLAKAGIGQEDGAYGHKWGSESGFFDVYNNAHSKDPHGQNLDALIRDPARLAQYQLIFFACSYNASFEFMKDTQVQNNLRDYVRNGGKLYVSDYAYAVVEMIWPEFIWFTDPLHGGCQENKFPDGCNHGPPFDAPSRSLDSDLSAWLVNIDPASTPGGQGGAEFETRENWNTIGDIFKSYVGDDPDTGNPVQMLPKVWVEGIWNYLPSEVDPGWDYTTYHPLTVSWPFGCGRVLYTTYHTVGDDGRHPGYLTQELVLWHLILELQACQENKIL